MATFSCLLMGRLWFVTFASARILMSRVVVSRATSHASTIMATCNRAAALVVWSMPKVSLMQSRMALRESSKFAKRLIVVKPASVILNWVSMLSPASLKMNVSSASHLSATAFACSSADAMVPTRGGDLGGEKV